MITTSETIHASKPRICARCGHPFKTAIHSRAAELMVYDAMGRTVHEDGRCWADAIPPEPQVITAADALDEAPGTRLALLQRLKSLGVQLTREKPATRVPGGAHEVIGTIEPEVQYLRLDYLEELARHAELVEIPRPPVPGPSPSGENQRPPGSSRKRR